MLVLIIPFFRYTNSMLCTATERSTSPHTIPGQLGCLATGTRNSGDLFERKYEGEDASETLINELIKML